MGFQCGDRVVYGIHGVCRIVGTEKKTLDHRTVEYYVLKPCAQGDAAFYVPMHNPSAVAKMRKMLTAEELENLLQGLQTQTKPWISAENLRKEHYSKVIAGGDCAELIALIHCLHRHKREQLALGKKFHQCDENFLKDAQRVVACEVSQILDIAPTEVEAYIKSRLQK